MSPHWLRHAHATHALERGAPIHLVAATLGHASVATTGKYLHARPDGQLVPVPGALRREDGSVTHDGAPVATRPPVRPRGPLGLLAGLSPAAFEAWVGDRLREAGYAVRVTPLQGEHGADLLATRAGAETAERTVYRRRPPVRRAGQTCRVQGGRAMKFMVQGSMREPPTAEILALIPAETTAGEALDRQGRRVAFYFAADGSTAWQVYDVESEAALWEALSTLPMTPFVDYRVTALAGPPDEGTPG